MKHLISKRVTKLKPSATLAMAKKAKDLQCEGIEIINLSVGEPDFKTPEFIQKAAIDSINSGDYFSYPPSPGYMDFRKVIAEKLRKENNIIVEPTQIVVSAGAKMSLSLTFMSILDPGDEVIIFAPYWVSYYDMVTFAEGTPVVLRGKKENNYKVTAQQLKDTITPKTKAILYSSPCNPTGAVFSQKEITQIADVISQRDDILIVADEIYEHIIFEPEHFSIGSLESVADRTITINGLSKGYSMTGWRLGYSASPQCIAHACSKAQSQLASATSGIVQRAGMEAILGGKEKIKYMIDSYMKRRDLIVDLFSKKLPKFKLSIPEGAFYLFPDISFYFGTNIEGMTINNSDDFVELLLTEAGVATVSGDGFGEPNCIRISFASSEQELKEAVSRIAKLLS